MPKITRRTGLAAGVLALGLTMTACGSGMSSTSSSSADTSGSAPTGVTLTLWHNTADTQALLDLYKAYEKYSGNTIKLVDIPSDTFPMTVQQKWATGDRPDLLEWHGNQTDALALNVAQNTLDLSDMDFVQHSGDIAQVSGNIDGHTYAATLGPVSVYGIFYNKAVLKKAGLSVPTSYADLAADCQALTTSMPNVTPLYETGGSGWPPQILSAFDYMAESNVDGAYTDAIKDGSAALTDTDGPFIKAMQAYLDLKKSGCFNSDATTATWEDGVKAVLNGDAAFIAQNTDSISLLDSDANGDTDKVDPAVGFAPVSATSAVANYAPSALGTYYVPKTGDTEKQRAALDFIEFATGKGYQDYIDDAGSIPTIDTATTPKLQGLWQDVDDALDGATLTINSAIPGFSQYGNESDSLLAGQESPAEVAKKMQAYFKQANAAAGN
ncbi:MAG: ABC transporter substrate-binding protein [Nocardioides sp.]|uniref:ABC transporter substrate-binding protein n=1 Tax=Nocardioides sp. TaxID=35761 RepID=UPI0039E6C3E9